MPISRQARRIRTAISPRLAIRIFLNISGQTLTRRIRRGALILTCEPYVCVPQIVLGRTTSPSRDNLAPKSNKAPRCKAWSLIAINLFSEEENNLLVLIHYNAARAGLLFCFLFLDGHGFVHPLVGSLQIGGPGCRVIALDVGAFPVHQVQVGHGVVVIRAKLESLVQVIDTFLNVGGIFLLHHGTDFFVLGRQSVVWLHAEFGALFLARHIGLRPVDDGNRVIRLGIIGIGLGSFLVVFLGQVEFLLLQVEVGDALYAVDVFGIHLKHLLVLVNRLLGVAVVLRSIGTRNVLLSEGCGQIKAGID